jgi:hypothetical protein
MKTRLAKELVEGTGGITAWKKFLAADRFDYKERIDVNLAGLTNAQLDAMLALVEKVAKAKDRLGRMAKSLQVDVANWKQALLSPENVKARGLKQFEGLLQQFLLKQAPGQRLYKRSEGAAEGVDAWEGYYVSQVKYCEPDGRNNRDSPPWVSMSLVFDELGQLSKTGETFRDQDVRGRTAAEVLLMRGFCVETDELLAAYERDRARFVKLRDQIGLQLWADGQGFVARVDGNGEKPSSQRSDHSSRNEWQYEYRPFPMAHDDGGLSKVVVDVFREEDRERETEKAPDPYYWRNVADGVLTGDETDEDAQALVNEDGEVLGPVDVPVHPTMIVFDLRRHLRMSLHVRQLADYEFDLQLADRLVLSPERKQLVRMLVESKAGSFRDIVRGKTGGAVILLAGPPGTGKTLTAEVFAESEGRALYSVQCSQLGISPEDLEGNLLKAFSRARRWNAVMLLDEADVYVRQRSNDLIQNAIVGVFLRMLEYQDTVLFLLTNRADDVDDAVASRCMAKLTYKTPSLDEQVRIWQVLTVGQGMSLDDAEVQQIADQNPTLSGRDVKNLLKLAALDRSVPLSADRVKFLLQFKPA